MPSQKFTIASLDHLVLTVSSIPKAIKWYTENLSMKHESFVSTATPDVTRHSLIFGEQKINLHEVGKEFSPHATTPLPGTSDLCFLTKTPIADVRKSLVASGVKIVELNEELDEDGCVMRTGARGKLRSVYCWDEDGNLIEISNYVDQIDMAPSIRRKEQ